MLVRVQEGEAISVGCCFYHYLPLLNYTFDKGEVVQCFENGGIEVDFGDTLVRFHKEMISYAYDTDTSEEFFMTIEAGDMVADYRGKPNAISGHDPELASFEEMLKNI